MKSVRETIHRKFDRLWRGSLCLDIENKAKEVKDNLKTYDWVKTLRLKHMMMSYEIMLKDYGKEL